MADRILVVDDEDKIRAVIRKYGEFEGYEIYEASNGMDAVEMCRENDYDLIIMDVMMPELDGFSACGAIKKIKDIPVIMLSARGEEYDRIHGFEVGVDDLDTADIFVYEGLEVNFTARTVSIDGVRVDMSPKEYDLLFYMVRNRNIALTREQLITEVWGYDYYGEDRTLDTHVKLLRNSLGPYRELLVTLRGVGYRFEVTQ